MPYRASLGSNLPFSNPTNAMVLAIESNFQPSPTWPVAKNQNMRRPRTRWARVGRVDRTRQRSASAGVIPSPVQHVAAPWRPFGLIQFLLVRHTVTSKVHFDGAMVLAASGRFQGHMMQPTDLPSPTSVSCMSSRSRPRRRHAVSRARKLWHRSSFPLREAILVRGDGGMSQQERLTAWCVTHEQQNTSRSYLVHGVDLLYQTLAKTIVRCLVPAEVRSSSHELCCRPHWVGSTAGGSIT